MRNGQEDPAERNHLDWQRFAPGRLLDIMKMSSSCLLTFPKKSPNSREQSLKKTWFFPIIHGKDPPLIATRKRLGA